MPDRPACRAGNGRPRCFRLGVGRTEGCAETGFRLSFVQFTPDPREKPLPAGAAAWRTKPPTRHRRDHPSKSKRTKRQTARSLHAIRQTAPRCPVQVLVSPNRSQRALARAGDLRHWPPLGADHGRRSAPVRPAHALCRNSVFKELQATGRRPSCVQLHQRMPNATQRSATRQTSDAPTARPMGVFPRLGPRAILSRFLSEARPAGNSSAK